ncbi:unnamed protein product [Linum tenue]|uniref:Uncharacterized protein n=1 Tax=Linum tenue TaxID=586396 RepID=A0AAV0L1W1_9ROSI|nr:unnamed protein product [Linum tenue]
MGEERFVHRLSQEQKDPSFASELIHPSAVNLLCRAWSNQLANLRGSERNWKILRSPEFTSRPPITSPFLLSIPAAASAFFYAVAVAVTYDIVFLPRDGDDYEWRGEGGMAARELEEMAAFDERRRGGEESESGKEEADKAEMGFHFLFL